VKSKRFVPCSVPYIFATMKKLVASLLVLMPAISIGQSLKVKQIDSVVDKIDKSVYDKFYRADSGYLIYDKDSNVIDGKSIELFYSNKKGKNLIKVDELTFWPDTSSTFYYFNDRQLVKVEHNIFKGQKFKAELYYEDGKVIYHQNQGNLIFQISYPTLFENSKKYLKYKPKKIDTNPIIY
jgi:hypothetical protein